MSFKVIATVIFILMLITIQFLYWTNPIVLTEVIKFHDEFLNLINHYELISGIIYTLAFMTSIIFGIPISITIIGGYIFGIINGTIFSIIGIFLGTLILCLFARYVWQDWIKEKYSDELKSFNKQLEKYGLFYVLIIHTTPFMPSFPLNLALGISDISLYKIMYITIISTFPLTIIYSTAGFYVHQLNSISDVVYYTTFFSAILALLYLIIFSIRYFFMSD